MDLQPCRHALDSQQTQLPKEGHCQESDVSTEIVRCELKIRRLEAFPTSLAELYLFGDTSGVQEFGMVSMDQYDEPFEVQSDMADTWQFGIFDKHNGTSSRHRHVCTDICDYCD